MSNYDENYARTHDIDLFCLDKNGNPIHIASNGSLIAIYFDEERNADILNKILSRETQSNKEVINQRAIVGTILDHAHFFFDRETAIESYLSSFSMMAQLGFCSYDVIGEKDNQFYCAKIAAPKNNNENNSPNFPELPVECKLLMLNRNVDVQNYYASKDNNTEE